MFNIRQLKLAFSQKRERGILFGALSGAISKSTALLSTILSIYLLSEYLDNEQFGLWASIIAITKLIGIADFGINNNVVNIVSNERGYKQNSILKTHLSNSVLITIVIGCILFTALLASTFHINWAELLGIHNRDTNKSLNSIIIITAITMAIMLPVSIVNRVQIGAQETWRMNIWLAIGHIASIVALFYVIKNELGLTGSIIASISVPVFITIINYGDYFYIRNSEIRPDIRSINIEKLKLLFSGSLIFFILQILAIIGHGIDNLIISNILGASHVSAYAATEKLAMALALAQLFILPLWPAIGDALAQNNIAWAKKSLLQAIYLSLIIGIFSGLIIFFFGKEIIILWTRGNLVPSDMTVLGFSIFSVITGVAGSLAAFLNNKMFLKRQLYYYLVATIAATLLKINLMPHWGDASAAIWANIIAYTFFFIIPNIFFIFNKLK